MLKQQGSNRIYTRQVDENGKSFIRVVGTNRDENRAFIYMAKHFHDLGLPVPELYSVSGDEMSYTQQDLGDTILFDAIKNGRETGNFSEYEITLLERTMRALAHVQIEGAQNFNWSVCFPVPAFDERSIRWDLNYFKYCFLKGTKIEFSEPALEDDFDRLVTNLTAKRSDSETFLYRDFQSRNVMLVDDQPYFIDFQGGRRGPTQYDVASFLWQAKANFPQSLREHLIDVYLDELIRLSAQRSVSDNGLCSVNSAEWKAALPHFVLFRTLQVLGAYGYRGFFERKPHFLESIPLALKNFKEICQKPVLTDGQPTVNRRSTDSQSQDDYNFSTVYPELTRLSEQLSCFNNYIIKTEEKASPSLKVKIYSFSFKRGIPEDDSGNGGGYVFDCRSTHNPGKYEEYKTLTGLDQPVIDFLENDGEILTFLNSVYALVDHHVERFIERDFSHLQVSFGCTGGQHRSVYCAEHLAKHLKEKYNIKIELIHRERNIRKTF